MVNTPLPAGRSMAARLTFQFRFKSLLAVGNVTPVAVGINECVALAALPPFVLRLQIEVSAVRAKEDVAGQGFEDSKLVAIIVRDLRIGRVADKFVAGVHIGAADDDDMQGFSGFRLVHGPGCGSLGVPGGFAGGENDSAE